jgi:hypothetical protein
MNLNLGSYNVVSKEEDEFGVLHTGRRCKRLKTGAKKGQSSREYEKREPYALINIVEIPHTKGEEEDY